MASWLFYAYLQVQLMPPLTIYVQKQNMKHQTVNEQ